MKAFIVAIASVLVFFSGLSPVQADDWTTTDGKTYKGVIVIKHDEATVTIIDDAGGASIPLAKLPPNLQTKFNYDPMKAKATIEQQAEQTQQQKQQTLINKAVKQNKKPFYLKVFQVVKGGFIGTNTHYYFDGSPGEDVYLYIECDNSKLVDGDWWTGDVWETGTYSYSTVNGSERTLRKYTADVSEYITTLKIK